MKTPLVQNFTNDFERSAYFERLAFSNFMKESNIFGVGNWEIKPTPYSGLEPYDILAIRYNNDGSIIKRLIIELKIRDRDFTDSGWVFETKKYKSMKAIQDMDPDNNRIVYINFTPTNTLLWKIDDIIGRYKAVKKEMNKATMDSRDNKINKSTYLLSTDDAYIFNYVWSESQYHQLLHQEALEREAKRVKHHQSLWDYLTGEQEKN